MKRRTFLHSTALASMAAAAGASLANCSGKKEPAGNSGPSGNNLHYPMAIAMWDFSWLERRWTGAGYEDWDKALDELTDRGYNCVRIDAFPHLIAASSQKKWLISPHWDNADWGSPDLNEIQVQPYLNEFIRKCAARNIQVALSTWWREDSERLASQIKSPEELGTIWVKALDSIASEGLLQYIEFVDLNNEFPIPVWTPYLKDGFIRNSPEGNRWMTDSIRIVRERYPQLKYTFSFTTEYENCLTEDVSSLDLLELHCWIVQFSDFYKRLGFEYTPWGYEQFRKIVKSGEKEYYRSKQEYQEKLSKGIELLAEWSRKSGKPVGTTECWGPIDYKDYPMLEWSWVKEICAFGTIQAAKQGRWKYIATSNFCGPQFIGMWRDIEWHRKLTGIIKKASLDADLA
jgi:hypothetical protein